MLLHEKAKPGRKPLKKEEKKIGITIYMKPDDIIKMGGKVDVRQSLINHIERQLK